MLRIIWNIERSCATPSITNWALKILWRQCSLLACANIISSTSVGLRCNAREGVDQVVDLVVGQRQAELGVRAHQRLAAAAEHIDMLERRRRLLVEQVHRVFARCSSTLSVMRSCSSAAQACSSSAVSGLAPPSRPLFSVSRNSVTRSTRLIAAPQLCAMSVAFEAHGETVPRRGATTISVPSAGPAYGSP